MRPWLPTAAVICLLVGCNTRAAREPALPASTPAPTAAMQDQAMPNAPARLRAAAESRNFVKEPDASADGSAPADELPGLGGASTAASDTGTAAMIIRTGAATVEVDTLEPTMTQLRQLAARLGGYIANSTVQGGRQQLRQATLELKIPARQFDDLTSALGSIGKVEYVNVAAEDVGEEYTDVAARVTNAQRLEQRLIDLLASRTGKLQDVLAVERELARVRETIERYEGRLRFLKAHAAMSTLSVTLHEPPLITANPGRNVIVEAFVRAWRNFVALVAALIASLGVVVPLAAVVAAIGLGWRRFHGRQPRGNVVVS